MQKKTSRKEKEISSRVCLIEGEEMGGGEVGRWEKKRREISKKYKLFDRREIYEKWIGCLVVRRENERMKDNRWKKKRNK